MSKHAIIVIKNSKNEYLQYFDEIWNSYLFLNCKLEKNDELYINTFVSKKLNINIDNISSKYIDKKVHKKFSQSAKREKEYEHYFYETKINNISKNLLLKDFSLNNINFSWFSYEELMNNKRIVEVNNDIINYVKKLKI